MNRYLIIHEYTCPECNGEKVYYNPDWTEANAAYDAANETTTEQMLEAQMDLYDRRAAASDAGWKALTEYMVSEGYGHDQKRWPPEELPCNECEGEGIIRKEVDLSEALQALTTGASITEGR